MELNPRIAHVFNDGTWIIRGAVVHDDAFPILVDLRLQRCQRERQGARSIEHGHQNGN
jgi:hypothetical protein